MSSVKERYRDINPVTLQLEGGTVSSSLFCEEADGLMEGAGPLVECFLVELFRCKLCQFTCGVRSVIRSHLLLRHRASTLAFVGVAEEDGRAECADEGSSPYRLGLTAEAKVCDEDEDFLLYNMLDNMSPPPCDISVETGDNCVVGTLFEEDESIFRMKEPSVDFSAHSPSEQEQRAQSAHLMTLGLCRITTTRPAPPVRSSTSIRTTPFQPPQSGLLSQQRCHSGDGETEAPPSGRLRLPCFLCPTTLTSRRLLDVHVRSHAADGGFCCVQCSWTTHSWAELLPHWRSHCRRRRQKRRKEPGFKSSEVQITEGQDVFSLSNQQPTAADQPESSLRVVGQSHPSMRVSQTQRSREKKQKLVEDVGAQQTSLCCSLCHRGFSSPLTLRRHMGVHGGEKVFSCSHCSYSSRLKGSLQQHLRTHTGEKPHTCTLCSYASIDRSSLIRHQRMHNQEKPHRCEQCQYSSIQKKSLELHVRRHHSALLFGCSAVVDELNDSFLLTRRSDDVWIIQFYAPWCSLCKQLDPIWRQVASELKSLGSPVNVGQSDATVNTALSREFRVRGYPAIIMWKKNMKYNYSGAKTRDGIMTWTLRVSGPTVRSLLTPQIFQLSRERHQVMFVYVGTTSELRGNFTSVAEEMIVHTHFFSAIKDVLPKDVSLSSLPTVVLFKDGTYEAYSEEVGGDLRRWVNKERFPLFAHIDSFTLYAMGDSGKLVVLALVAERGRNQRESERFKCLLERVATERRHLYKRIFYFGYMNQMDYIKGLMMSDVIIPSFVVVNLTNDGYFLPDTPVEAELQLVGFLEGIINGSVQSQGGNSVFQRIRRLVYEVNVTLTLLFPHGPLLGCFLVSILSIIMAVLYFLCCKARRSLPYEGDDVTERKKLMNKKSD
ncbi:uncharacterized protein LOC103398758 isoform X2 [Cynoglossus semilaevis]|uniref:uncharacterized protein LOC103398758 isoform X2 n=1 Tax=Cynoglossus semilaevis TaxID=244447 RepID=UPI000D62546A|nr:uncharacterized protein LOC103398758 isoform X2 [Cynoglossus semilaevis]